MAKKYVVALMAAERDSLEALTRRGSAKVRRLKRALALLAVDAGDSDVVAAGKARLSVDTVERLRRRCVEGGWRRRWASGPAPARRGRWTASRRRTWWRWPAPPRRPAGSAGRCNSSRTSWWRAAWRRPSATRRCGGRSKGGGEALAAQAVVPADGGRGVRGGDGGCARPVRGAVRPGRAGGVLRRAALPTGVGDARPAAAAPGRGARYDYEYKREGTANLFIAFEPKAGRRRVAVTARRTAADFAEQIRRLVDEDYPHARRVRVVLDNLNTHTPAALYRAFAPAEARRILRRLEFHYTPKHGSWLNQAEVEWSVLGGQCLDRRIGDVETLTREVAAWEQDRNAAKATVAWRFTASDARTKLARLYPAQS